MKKLLMLATLWAVTSVFPAAAMAGVDVGISISLPPPVVFAAPPEVVVLPGTYVYAVPDMDADIFFYNGWWWRLWDGRWYRSHYYDSGWVYYRRVPSFYAWVPPGWRNDYREHRWRGQQWNYRRIPPQQVQRNWKSWEKDRHWEKQHTWGVPGMKPQARPQQPARAVQPNPQAHPRGREISRPPQPQQQPPRVQPQHIQPQPQRVQPQHIQPQRVQPQHIQPQHVQPQHIQPQQQPQRVEPHHREAPQPAGPRQENPGRGDEEKHERR